MESVPEVYQNGYCAAEFAPENAKNGDHFIVEDLLDLPNDESMVAADGGFESLMTDCPPVTAVDTSCKASFPASTLADTHFHPADFGGPGGSAAGGNFSGELCVPYDDLAELEWLSNFVEESFSSEDLQKLQMIQGVNTRRDGASETHHYQFQPDITPPGPLLRPEMPVPAKARSKRSRAAPGNWASRLLVVSSTPPATVPSSSESDISAGGKKSPKPAVQKKKEGSDNSGSGEGRKCLHCATDKTPQWRTGPMGPKTLCNACGVRYKSGRLVPEYRPAASPTFVLTKHSNSHRKVLELRRQKELQRAQEQQQQQQQQQQLFHHHHYHQNMMFDVSNGEDYLIHQRIGNDFRQLI